MVRLRSSFIVGRPLRILGPAALLCAAVISGPDGSRIAAATRPGGRAHASLPPGGAAAQPGPLANTAWRLVEIQSMDDAVGTVRPDDPSLYTMRLGGDGAVALRLNCNRASGTWSAQPGADPSSGRFEFGPLAGTRALCPPPSLDERVLAQARYVRSYLLKEGRLYLSLMADGGIYAWERSPDDATLRTRDGALLKEFAALKARCDSRWAQDAGCLTQLRELRARELTLFSDVRSHEFSDLTESNYWHRGRLKFPSEMQQLLARVGGGGTSPPANPPR